LAESDIKLEVKSVTSQAQNDLVKLEQRQIEIEKATRKMGAAQKQASATLDTLSNSAQRSDQRFSSLIKTGLGMIGVAGAISKATQLIVEFDRRLDATADKVNQLSKSALGLYQVSGGDTAIQKRAALQGARYGVMPQDAGEVLEPLLAVMDKKTATQAAESSFKLIRLGAKPEAAGEAITKGIAQGVSPAQTAANIAYTALVSTTTPTTMTDVLPSTMAYSSQEMGLVAASVLSQRVKPEQLEQYTKSAGLGLNDADNKQLMKLIKDAGGKDINDFSEIEKLELIKNKYGARALDPNFLISKVGVGDERKAFGVAALIGGMEDMKARMAASKPIDMPDTMFSDLMKNPTYAAQYTSDVVAAQSETDLTTGAFGAESQRTNLLNLIKGRYLRQKGLGRFVDTETGKPGFWGRHLLPLEPALHNMYLEGTLPENLRPAYQQYSNMPLPDQAESDAETKKILGELRNDLRENTAATRENSRAAQTSRPSPRNANSGPGGG